MVIDVVMMGTNKGNHLIAFFLISVRMTWRYYYGTNEFGCSISVLGWFGSMVPRCALCLSGTHHWDNRPDKRVAAGNLILH